MYVGPRLLVSPDTATDTVVQQLRTVAETLGWEAVVHAGDGRRRARPTTSGELGVVRLDLEVRDDKATLAPDGWVLLQHARARYGLEAMRRVGLDHIVMVRSIGAEPVPRRQPVPHASPFHDASPFEAPLGPPSRRTACPGSGGRQPIAYAGPAPVRRKDDAIAGRRPVVATLDTGCGTHDWLKHVVTAGPGLDGEDIGYTDDETDPEKWFDQVGALDGGIDTLAGHGTFIAGLIHQACPDADIVTWRIVGSDGPIVESDLVKALQRHRRGGPPPPRRRAGRVPIDVLNLSMGYYHETPEDQLFDPTMYDILRADGSTAASPWCARPATTPPPARCSRRRSRPWADDKPDDRSDDVEKHHPESDVVPIVSVGALNPNGTDALFSNAGPWVRAYAPGAAVMSTLPPFQGGLEPAARTEAYQRVRESIDPDDFTGSFAVWSGTSFSAPLFAGRVASRLVDGIDPVDDGRAGGGGTAPGRR